MSRLSSATSRHGSFLPMFHAVLAVTTIRFGTAKLAFLAQSKSGTAASMYSFPRVRGNPNAIHRRGSQQFREFDLTCFGKAALDCVRTRQLRAHLCALASGALPPEGLNQQHEGQSSKQELTGNHELTKRHSVAKTEGMRDTDTLHSDFEGLESWFAEELRGSPTGSRYPELTEQAIAAVFQWRRRCPPKTFARMAKKHRLLKEVEEALPVIHELQAHIAQSDGLHEQPSRITVVDLCSGFGYLSMLLSDILPPENVERILLIDNAFPLPSSTPSARHINPVHLSADLGWPIPLVPWRFNIKKSREMSRLLPRIFGPDAAMPSSSSTAASWQRKLATAQGSATSSPPETVGGAATELSGSKGSSPAEPGPVLVLGIHLCGQLSIKAVEMFNSQPRATMLALKPCCLPSNNFRSQRIQLGGHAFEARRVTTRGRYVKGEWVGEGRQTMAPKFRLWVESLFEGIDVGPGGSKEVREMGDFTPEEHYQQSYLFASRAYGAGGDDNASAKAAKEDARRQLGGYLIATIRAASQRGVPDVQALLSGEHAGLLREVGGRFASLEGLEGFEGLSEHKRYKLMARRVHPEEGGRELAGAEEAFAALWSAWRAMPAQRAS